MRALPRLYNVAGRRLLALVFAAGVVAVLVLAWPAHASHREWTRELPWRLAEAKVVRGHTWSCESSAGLSRSAYPEVRWNLPVQQRRFHTLSYWRSRLNICHASRPAHLQGWLCIHSREGAWNDAGAPYYGGLQMSWNWMGRVPGGDAGKLSPLQQMWIAERESARHGFSYGWMHGQWPNTFPPCAGWFA